MNPQTPQVKLYQYDAEFDRLIFHDKCCSNYWKSIEITSKGAEQVENYGLLMWETIHDTFKKERARGHNHVG